MSKKGSVKDFYETITTEHEKKMAEYTDTAMFAYVKGCFDAITARGDDPEDFELLFIRGELKTDETNTYSINTRIRVRRFQ